MKQHHNACKVIPIPSVADQALQSDWHSTRNQPAQLRILSGYSRRKAGIHFARKRLLSHAQLPKLPFSYRPSCSRYRLRSLAQSILVKDN